MSSKTKFIRAMGVPRSGNHPIIKFVCENAGPRGYIHFNLCKPLQNPVEAHLTVETREGLLRPAKPEDAIRMREGFDLGSFDVVVFSYEDLFLDAHHGLEHRISEPFEDRIDYNLYITRSLPNWMASWMQQRLKKLKKKPDAPFNLDANPHYVVEKVIRVFRNWLVHLREVDAAITTCGTRRQGGAYTVGAVFDQFYADTRHRAQILDHLGLDRCSLDLPALTEHGGGSSFTGIKITDPAALEVEDRWSAFKDNHYFAQLLRLFWLDDEVRALCARHFAPSAAEIDRYLSASDPGALAKAG